MQMNFYKSIIVLSMFIGLSSYGQSANSEKENVSNTVNALYGAMVDPNKQILELYTTDDLSYGHSSGTLEDKDKFIDEVLNGSFDYLSIIPDNQTINISGKNAVVRHLFKAKGSIDGKVTDVQIGVLMVFQKKNDLWKLLARQAYKL